MYYVYLKKKKCICLEWGGGGQMIVWPLDFPVWGGGHDPLWLRQWKKRYHTSKKKSKESENWLCIRLRTLRIAHLLRQKIFLAIFSLFYFVNFLSTLSKQSIRTQKLKIGKLSFHGVQNIAQLFVTKTQFGYFWGGGKWGLHDVN